MTLIERKLHEKRLNAILAIMVLRGKPQDKDTKEAIHVLDEYTKLMASPINPDSTRGRVI